MEWMTAGELADFYNDLMRRTSDSALKHVDANTPIGFYIHWETYMANDVAELFILDPLRLGRGAGEAVTADSGWAAAGGLLTDLSRATAFLPVGKLVKAGAVVRTGAVDIETMGKAGGAYRAAIATRAQPKIAAMSRSLIQEVRDPASGRGICAFVGVAQGLRHRGSLFMPISRLAKIVGVEAVGDYFEALEKAAPQFMVNVGGWLGKLNVPYEFVKGINYAEQVLRYAETAKRPGVYFFGVKWLKGVGSDAQTLGHLMYVGQTATGEWRIFDRTGHAVRNLAELAELVPGYKAHGLGKATFALGNLDKPIFVPNAKLVQITSSGVEIGGVSAGVAACVVIPIRIGTYLLSGQSKRR